MKTNESTERSKSITGIDPGSFRPGKTRRDRANNAHARNAANKDARATWQNDSKATNAANSFPYGSCNGKRNRALKERTGKGKK
jgi:hypothetical protein